jgi:hypothetical protein
VGIVPKIDVNPRSVDFNVVPAGGTSDLPVIVKNVGLAPLTLGAIGSPSAPFSKTGGTCTNSQVLSPGDSCTVIVRFAPTAPGSFSSGFDISSNDPVDPVVTVNLAGKSPSISVTPAAYDFGDVKVKKNKTASFVVKNGGKKNLSISSAVTGADPSIFPITTGSGNKTIKPGKTLTLKVAFKPTSKGAKSAILRITSDDPAAPITDIELKGAGI